MGYVEKRVTQFIDDLKAAIIPCHAVVEDYVNFVLNGGRRWDLHPRQRSLGARYCQCPKPFPFKESFHFDFDHPDNQKHPYKRTRHEETHYPTPQDIKRPESGHGSCAHRPVMRPPLLDRFGCVFQRLDLTMINLELVISVKLRDSDDAKYINVGKATFIYSQGNYCDVNWVPHEMSSLTQVIKFRGDEYMDYDNLWHVELTKDFPVEYRQHGEMVPWPTAILASLLTRVGAQPAVHEVKESWRFVNVDKCKTQADKNTKFYFVK
jgi:hypothetical protein